MIKIDRFFCGHDKKIEKKICEQKTNKGKLLVDTMTLNHI